jgi:hypothetical protein
MTLRITGECTALGDQIINWKGCGLKEDIPPFAGKD